MGDKPGREKDIERQREIRRRQTRREAHQGIDTRRARARGAGRLKQEGTEMERWGERKMDRARERKTKKQRDTLKD